jgi:hypothetical protein
MEMPSGPVAGLHVTSPVSPPQHSDELVQRLFRILQPRPGWQTLTPLSAHGPQFRLQQSPQPLQTTPSWRQVPAPVVWTSWQTPSVAPWAFAHQPPQQSVSREQASPGWIQKDAPSAHLPFEHRPEQHSVGAAPSAAVPMPLLVQGLPAVRQAAFSGWQCAPLQLPLQHSAEVAQVWLSAVQLAAVAQTWRAVSHCRLQQSVASAHELPGPLHVVIDDLHCDVAGSHAFEQHCPSDVQASPGTAQTTLLPPPPSGPPSL